jgi:hypothetical protein
MDNAAFEAVLLCWSKNGNTVVERFFYKGGEGDYKYVAACVKWKNKKNVMKFSNHYIIFENSNKDRYDEILNNNTIEQKPDVE